MWQTGFKGVLHNDGLPQLNANEWARMMIIAALEYGITKLQKVKEMNQNTPKSYNYDMMIRKEHEMLSSLTENKEPDELISQMIKESIR